MPFRSYIRHPHASTSGLTTHQVVSAYNLPPGTGSGITIGIIELGGALSFADMRAAGIDSAKVTCVNVAGGKQQSDGPNGADGEVALDVQVVAAVAPGAQIRCYFAKNDDAGFLAAIQQAAQECQIISISWGGAESEWDPASISKFEAAFKVARAAGVLVFAAAGDSGSKDGSKADAVDYPASSPNVIGCGGTRLTLTSAGSRKSEVVWDDNPTSSATGGGISKLFPNRTVPDVAGNADPQTGYRIVVDGQTGVIGGTSAVAPLMAGCCAVLFQLNGGNPFDFLTLAAANPTSFFDVTAGNNGSFRAGPGRDDVSGLGVPDFGKLLTALQGGVQPPPPPVPAADPWAFIANMGEQITAFLKAAGNAP